MPTGIFYYYQKGERLGDFPDIPENLLGRENVFFFDAFYPLKPRSNFDIDPIPIKTLRKVHTPQTAKRVIASGSFAGAMYSAAGTVAAPGKVLSVELNNAFVFTGFGDHHTGSVF